MLAQAYAVLLDRMPYNKVRPHTPSAMLLQKLHGRLQPPEKILGRSEARPLPSPSTTPPPPHTLARAAAVTGEGRRRVED